MRPYRPSDDPAVRALLRRQAVGGSVRITYEREPSYDHAARLGWDRLHTFLGETDDGELAGTFCRSVGPAWLEGEPVRLGYLGQLRRAEDVRLSRRLLRTGFAACEATREPDELPFDLTSIVADNRAARRLLERGLPGLPVYRPWAEMTTLLIPTPPRPSPLPGRVLRGSRELLPEIVCLLAEYGRRRALTPRWSEEDLLSPERAPGLAPEDFLILTEPRRGGPVPVATLAVWDQRSVKQWRVRGYGGAFRRLDRVRPVVAPALRLARRLGLPLPPLPPPVGEVLPVAFAACRGADAVHLPALLEAALSSARGKGLDLLAVGLPRQEAGQFRRRFPARAYESRLYLVTPRDAPEATRAAEDVLGSPSPPGVEVAIL